MDKIPLNKYHSILDNNAAHPVIYKGWNFTLIWKTLVDRMIFTKREIRSHKTNLTPPHFIEASVPKQDRKRSCIYVLCISIFASFYDFSIRFWNCSSINVHCNFNLYRDVTSTTL